MDPLSYEHSNNSSQHDSSFTDIFNHANNFSFGTSNNTNLNETNFNSHLYDLEAIPQPYQTIVAALFICTAIISFFFNCIALRLILCKRGPRSRSVTSGCSGGGGTAIGGIGSRTLYSRPTVHLNNRSPKDSIAQIKPNGKVCEVLNNCNSLPVNTHNTSVNSPKIMNNANPTGSTTPVVAGQLCSFQSSANLTQQNSSQLLQQSPTSQHYQFQPRSSSTQVLNQHVLPTTTTRLRTGSSSQLNIYLINLFINDLIIALLNVPFTYTDFMYGQWIYWSWLCPTINFISTCAVGVSIYTLIAIGFERYFAIICPFKKLGPFERHTKYIIGLIWLIGIALAIPVLIKSRAVTFKYRNETLLDCREMWEQKIDGKVYTGVIFVATFLLPFFVLTFLYISIAVKAFRHVIPGNADVSRDQLQLRTKVRMIKMLVLLVITFVICWLPLQTFNMVMWLCDGCPSKFSTPGIYNFYVALTFVCQWFSIAHAMLDPIIYCFSSRNFNIREILYEIHDQVRSMFCCINTPIPPFIIGMPASTTSRNSECLRPTSSSSSTQHRNSTISKVSGRASLNSSFSAAQHSSHSSIQRFTFEPSHLNTVPDLILNNANASHTCLNLEPNHDKASLKVHFTLSLSHNKSSNLPHLTVHRHCSFPG